MCTQTPNAWKMFRFKKYLCICEQCLLERVHVCVCVGAHLGCVVELGDVCLASPVL